MIGIKHGRDERHIALMLHIHYSCVFNIGQDTKYKQLNNTNLKDHTPFSINFEGAA